MISEHGIHRIRGMLRRRRLSVAAAAAAVLVGSALFIGKTERVYRASAVLRALESQPAKEYVAPTMAEQVGERLKTLRLAVMARPILDAVVADLHLDRAYGKSAPEVVDEMRTRMEVKVEGEDTFLLTYEDSDAVRAREVVNQVVNRFIADQVERRNEVATATERALRDEVERLRPQLAQLEGKVRDFKLAHYGSLPEQQEENLRTLDQTTMEVNIQATNLDLEEEHRRQLLLSAMSPMRHQEDQLATQLHEALTKYTPDHPEVHSIQSELSRVREARLVDERRLRANAGADPELVALDGQISRSRAQVHALRSRQAEVRSRLADTAKNGQALMALTTDLDAVRAKYQGAIGKLHEAELAVKLEQGLRGLRYDTVEGAAQPMHPVRPNRPLMALGALALAALLGLGVGFAKDFADTSIHTPDELAALGHPVDVLACVPELEDGPARS
jgi:uncharacterized protein involved in exopolysaccharide biosynthesis